jgi:ABC-type transport system involved in Fe-S cluster assembly fused permease/ATPase subunit
MLFHLKSDWESNTKEIGDFLKFSTVIYFPTSNQLFRRYDFLQDYRVAENCILDKLQHQKKIKFWGCSDGILP